MSDEAVIGETVAAEVGKLAPEAKSAARTQMAKFYPTQEIDRVFGPANAPPAPVQATPSRKQQLERANSPAFTKPNEVPPTPEGYTFNYSHERLMMDTTALATFSGELRTALHTAQVPAILGQPVLDALDVSAALYPPTMPDVERNAIFQEEGWKLRRTFGEAGAKEIVALASAAYFRLPEAFRAKMDAQFGFHTAQAQSALAAIEREYRHRTGTKS